MSDIPKIALKGVRKRFGDKHVLNGVDLNICAGESMVIIGGSGTGKSVTIKCILGLIRPDAGHIEVDGQDVTHLKGRALAAHQARFGMLFQGGALFDSLSVWRNVTFALTQGKNRDPKKMHALAIETLARVGLGPEVVTRILALSLLTNWLGYFCVAGGLFLFAGGAYLAYQLFGTVQTRVGVWLHTFAPQHAADGYQLQQSLFGLGTGGIHEGRFRHRPVRHGTGA